MRAEMNSLEELEATVDGVLTPATGPQDWRGAGPARAWDLLAAGGDEDFDDDDDDLEDDDEDDDDEDDDEEEEEDDDDE